MQHPLVIIGAGPIGLAAAANAAERGMDFVVLEAGPDAGAAIGEWAHVRLFSAWRELIDPAARRLLEAAGTWTAPDEDTYPTGGEWREAYLQPLADLLDATAGGAVRYGTRVVGVSRAGRDLLVDSGRESDPFAVHVETAAGRERLLASAVVDASGTWTQPNPLGADGYPALGERENADRITYGIPDFTDPAVAARYAGKHVAVAGKGASAQGVLIGLAKLARQDAAQTRVSWLLRRPSVGDAFGGGDNDQLEQRGKLGQDAKAAAAQRAGHQRHPVPHRVRHRPGRRPTDASPRSTVSRCATSTRSSSSPASGPTSPSSPRSASTSTPPWAPRGSSPTRSTPTTTPAATCSRTASRSSPSPRRASSSSGMKSYGRAPSFLAMTGFEQVRSVVAALDGDLEAAARVDLVLPETGVCNGAGAFDDPDAVAVTGGGCCGAPAASEPQLITLGRPGQ